MPPQKRWWHVTLRATAVRLTTTPMPVDDKTLEVLLDLTQHRLCLTTSLGEKVKIPLRGQSPRRMFKAFESGLATLGVGSGISPRPSRMTRPASMIFGRRHVSGLLERTRQLFLRHGLPAAGRSHGAGLARWGRVAYGRLWRRGDDVRDPDHGPRPRTAVARVSASRTLGRFDAHAMRLFLTSHDTHLSRRQQ